MRLLAITDPRCPASTRYRVTQFESYLRAKGVQLRCLPWPDDWNQNRAAQSELLAAVSQAEVVLLQRHLPDSAALHAIRRGAARLIYDFDDAVIYSESTRRKSRRRFVHAWRFRQMIRCCDLVTAGNEYLAALARRHAPAGRVHVLPTVLEPKRYESALSAGAASSAHNGNRFVHGCAGSSAASQLAANGTVLVMDPVVGRVVDPVVGPVVGWIGSSSTLPYLEALRRPLEELSREIPGLSLRVIADRRPDFGHTFVEWVRWSSTTEAEELKRLRVGLAPLPDDPWTRGKCGLRLLQYLAAGVPAVASPVGTQSEVTASGAALPARSPGDWVAALRRILTDQALAQDLTFRGSRLVRERFAAPVLADSMYSLWCQGK